MYVCPRTGGPLKDWHSRDGHVTYPLIDGVPILVADPVGVLATHPPRVAHEASVVRLGVPDAITPHLAPSMFGAPGGFGQWLTTLGDQSPDQVAAGFAHKLAPNRGRALDVGCGVGAMARRMAVMGWETWAFDRSVDAVLLARGMLTGGLTQATIPTSRRGIRRVKVPFKVIPAGLNFCVADATRPPFAPDTFGWVHLGDVLDSLGEELADGLVAAAGVLQRGGILTINTCYGASGEVSEGGAPPEEELLEALDALGLQLVEQQDRIPHVSRVYDRSFQVRFFHVLVARKR
jgi:SAM-dependent methyltransferase